MAPTLALVLVVLGAAPVSATQAPAPERHVSEAVVSSGQAATLSIAAAPAPCSDRAYRLSGGKWKSTLKWHFRASSTPSRLSRDTTRRVIKRSFANIVNARNDCGRSDRVAATSSYEGTTTRRARCNVRDGRNVVAFKALPSDVLARTCWWVSGTRIIEADIQINSAYRWATSLSNCSFQPMLEAVMTHEVGHAFGLGHVGEAKHGRLTMSTRLDGPCNNQEATLGLGDMRGLEALY
jgi:predicted Zn-dependent protease